MGTALHRLGTSEEEWRRVLGWVVSQTRNALMAEHDYHLEAYLAHDVTEALKEIDVMSNRIERWRYVRRAVLTGDDPGAFQWALRAMRSEEPPEPPDLPGSTQR